MRKAYLYIFITAFVFSTIEIVGKLLVGELHPVQVTFWRFLIGAVILLPFAVKDIKVRNIKLKFQDVKYFCVTGILCIPISMLLLQLAVEYGNASTAAIIISINPIFTIPFACILLHEKVYKNKIISIALSLVGIILIINPFSIDANIKGIVIALGSAVTFSLYSVITKMEIDKYGGYVFNFFTFLFGDIILLFIMIIGKFPITKGITSSNLTVLIYMGIFITGLGYVTYIKAISETSASTASVVFFLKPAIATILAFVFLHEKISLGMIGGMVIIIFASYIGVLEKEESVSLRN